jgi:hypothetical protein
MSKYLSQVTEVYRVNSEAEAAVVIEEAKKDNRFTLLKSSTEYKPVKAKGELVDEYWKLTLVKFFTSLKEPDCSVSVDYSVDQGYFPEVETINED